MKRCDWCPKDTDTTYTVSKGDDDAEVCAPCYVAATERVA